ncbi:unnamed protein product [Amoebophrya sp. A25]|nr:unnamed protein product [Amoebophrya sp. A25]|eukprot:GSA25T00011341001.1
MAEKMTHVGAKFGVSAMLDVDKLRDKRIHDADAPKIVELGQAWAKLGPRPIIKSYSTNTFKKPTKLPRISRKKMAQAESLSSLPAAESEDSPIVVEEMETNVLDPEEGGVPSQLMDTILREGTSPDASPIRKAILEFEEGTSTGITRKGIADCGGLAPSQLNKPLPPYGLLVPPKHLAESSLEADTILNARLDDIEHEGGNQKAGERPGRKPREASPVPIVGSSASSSSSATVDEQQRRSKERLALLVGSQLFEKAEDVDLGELGSDELEKFDVPDRFEDKTEAEWIDECSAEPDSIHAHVLHFEDGDWILKECWVRDFREGRYLCELLGGSIKWVKRLCLRFVREDPRKWADRIKTAKMKRQQAILQHKLLRYIDSVSGERTTEMSRTQKESFVSQGLTTLEPKQFARDPMSAYYVDISVDEHASSNDEGGGASMGLTAGAGANNPGAIEKTRYLQQYVPKVRELMFEVESVYLWSMKLSITKQNLIERNGFPDAYIPGDQEFYSLLVPFLPASQQFRLYALAEAREVEKRKKMESDLEAFDKFGPSADKGIEGMMADGGAEDAMSPKRAPRPFLDLMQRRKQHVYDAYTLASVREALSFFGLVEPMPEGSLHVRDRVPVLVSKMNRKQEGLVRTTFEKFRQMMDLSLLDCDRGQNLAILQMGMSNADPGRTAQKLKQLKKQQQQKMLVGSGKASSSTSKKGIEINGKVVEYALLGRGNAFPAKIFGTTGADFYNNYMHRVRDKEALDFLQSPVELSDLLLHMHQHRVQVQQILAQDWRDFIVSDVVDRCGDSYNFFTDDLEKHMASEFHPFLHKLDLVLHSQLREFFQTSMQRWVEFFLLYKDASLNILKVGEHYVPDNTPGSGMIERRRRMQEAARKKAEEARRKAEEEEARRKAEEEAAADLARRIAEGEEPPPAPKAKAAPKAAAAPAAVETRDSSFAEDGSAEVEERPPPASPMKSMFAKRSQPVPFECSVVQPEPLLIIHCVYDEETKKVAFRPSLKDLEEQFANLTYCCADAVSEVMAVEFEMVSCCNMPATKLFQVTKDAPVIQDAVKVVCEVLHLLYQIPEREILQKYQRFTYLFDEPEPLNMRKWEEVLDELQKLEQARDKIDMVSGVVESFPLFEIHCYEVLDTYRKRIDELMQSILSRLQDDVTTQLDELDADWKVCRRRLTEPVENEDQMSDLKKYLPALQKNVINPQLAKLKLIGQQIMVLHELKYKELDRTLVERQFDAFHWPQTVLVDREKRLVDLTKEQMKFQQVLQSEKEQYARDFQKWKEDLQFVKTKMDNFSKAKDYDKLVTGLKDALIDAKRRLDDFRKRESLFNIELSETEPLDELSEEYEDYYSLWNIAIDFTYNQEEWTQAKFTTLNATDVMGNCETWFKTAYKMSKLFDQQPVQLKVATALVDALKEFNKKLPLIESCCHPAFEVRHWNQIFFDNMDLDVDALPEFADYTMSLKQLEEQNIMQFIDVIQEVSAGAQKEYSLRVALQNMKREWDPMIFGTMSYKETGTYLLRGLDDVQTLLDDHIMKTQAVRGSPFCKPFERECRDWEAKLLYIQDSLDQVLQCQKQWLYLEPIFASEDIVRQMPAEASKFKRVDERWRETLAIISTNPSVIEFADIENLYTNFVEANVRLDQITKGLNDYLETKRLYFPRFFFLSNDELLSILSETKDPTKVQPHMGKAFEGIAKVRFDKNSQIIEAMISAEGEIVELIKKINVDAGENKGNVEKWLLEVEHSMVATLKDVTTKSIKDYQSRARTDWVVSWPGQVVICVDMIVFSDNVGKALEEKNIQRMSEQIEAELSDVVVLVRGELPKLARRTLGAMTTIDVHNRDVVNDLVKKNVDDPAAFDWIAQLRYYWHEPKEVIMKLTGKPNDTVECSVRIINSLLYYAFEYLGNSDRLVITALTDRCYRTLMGAFDLYYGGAPEGPAGTGKTESVKDLAKALAIQCVVFNCSDGLDFLAMAKFFKGLAASGAWCCFDEFNRINAEVLSVIAQQVMTIQMAIIEKKKRFLFEGTELSLIPTCAVNITMNPGYAGRVELPDNLKALFRPCAMMVPDYAMIGEIFLYSYGFQYAKDLGIKATQALRLSSEQLSPQAHYDFGMRGLKSLLVASGNMKRKYGDKFPEFTLALRGFLDVNLPKFTAADVPLFDGIVGDLFPGVELPPADTELYEKALTEACVELGLQPTKYFILKAIQLFETLVVRHGLMTVGLPPCGKTSINNALSIMLEKLQDGENLRPVIKYILNPKSIPKDNLYGSFDENTHEWADGVLAVAVRMASSGEETHRHWVMMDGPIDAIWIEDMNTVLDDNKKLCLLSGEIIKLSPSVNMMFETADLAVASPATVSRCGMVLMEPENVSWRPLIQSWIARLPEHIEDKVKEQIYEMFDAHLDMTIDLVKRMRVALPTETAGIGLHGWMGVQVGRLLESLLVAHAPAPGEGPDGKPTKSLNLKEMETRVDILFYFSLLWTVGGCIEEGKRPLFDQFLREIITGGDGGFLTPEQLRDKYDLLETKWRHVPSKQQLPDPEKGSVYDFFVDEQQGKWVPWLTLIKPHMTAIPDNAQFHNIIVPTGDTARNQYLMQIYCAKQPHQVNVLFCGITGTGKTVAVQNQLLTGFDEEKFTSMSFAFSAATTSKQTQEIIDGKLDKRRRGVFGPPVGKTMVIFVDDLNMPTKEEYGAQPPLEILRQFFCQQGWYDRKTNEFRQLEDLLFIGAMGPPGGGKNTIPARYLWHYNLIFVTPYSEEGLGRIFMSVLKWFFTPFPSSISQAVPNLVKASLDMYESASGLLRPTPTKSHYAFNLRDLSKIFQGLTLCSKPSLPDVDSLVRCWAHECSRIFEDRLINDEDKAAFKELLKEKMEEHFKKKWPVTVKLEPLIFVDFMNNKQIYEEVTSHTDLIAKVQELLNDFNAVAKHQMNLVLFLNFVNHVSKIVRVLRLPLGNALCVGVGGSGRKSVSTLASAICEYDIFQIEISKSYGPADWHDDLKRLLINCGGKQKPFTFLFSDTQVQRESFLEDISSILNTGEVPNLYNMEDKSQILDMCAKGAQAEGKMGNAAVFAWYVDQCKKFLHITLCLSPIGAAFRLRLRNYPSLVNCCTIDWFLTWPDEALESVAKQFLKKEFTDKDGNVDEVTFAGIVQTCVKMQGGVFKLTERFRNEIRRHYYVTPTSYLELVNCFMSLLGKKKNEVSTAKSRYDVGLDKIMSTEVMVQDMQKELEDLQPVLVKMTKENQEQMVVIEKSSKEAAVTKGLIEEEEKEANIIQAEASKMAEDCQRDLDEALPALQAAVSALNSLSKGDIVEVKAMKSPPPGVILTTQALCIMFDVAPMKIKDPAGGNKKVDDFWEPGKKKLYGDTNLLKRMIEYDKDNIPEATIAKVKPFEADPNFDPEAVKKSSVAAAGMCKWVRAMIVYERVAREVGPKREALAASQAKLKQAVDKLALKKAELKEVLDKLQELEDGLAASKKKSAELAQQVQDCKTRLARAEKLISGLGGEKGRWQISSKKLGEAFINLAGDILISSGIIAYLGVFTMALRSEEVQSWTDTLNTAGIPCTQDFKLAEIIGEAVTIRQWVIDKLPNDALSIDNAIMKDNSARWPLMIDPQLQANKWVRTTFGEELKVLRLTKSDYARHLETCIQFGKPVLIENVGEVLDPMLQPLLERAIFKAGSLSMIRLGDNTIEYNAKFKLFLTSKLPNPHYAPEVCVTVIILNFVTTIEGLTDSLLALLVAKESPDVERKRVELVVESANSAAQLKEIEDKILYLLSASTGNILDDEELITTLANSKVASVRIEERVVVQQRTAKEIAEVREFNQPVAARSSALFFVVSDLANIESNYQYSLEWFVSIFLDSIDAADKARGTARLEALNRSFLFKLYVNICRSLFEKDKLLFSFLTAIKMLEFDRELNRRELNLLMQGGGGGGALREPKPDVGWLTDVSWSKVLELDKLGEDEAGDGGIPLFKDWSKRYAKNIDVWEKVFESEIPQEAEWPEGLNADRYGHTDDTTALEQALILLAFRPDGLVTSIQDIIMEKLGKNYLEPPPFDLKVSYQESKPHIPLLFVLTVGADPMSALLKLAEGLGMQDRMFLLSLGQGQGPKADAAIADSTKNGAWVVLQNCHLAESYMAQLEATCENFSPNEIHPEFRLWLTGMPAKHFPVSILQNGVKMTVEPPKGLKQNLTRAYLGFDGEWMETCTKPHAMKKMLFGLAFFHALILERRKFGPLGWNIPYAFSDPDRTISSSQLKIFLDSYDEIQWAALNYLVAEANYGGRVTDGSDRRTIKCILSDFYCPEILDDDYKFSTSGVYYSPDSRYNKDKCLEFIGTLPLQEYPEAFGLHQNADLTAKISEGMAIIKTAVNLLPRDTGGSGKTSDEIWTEKCDEILGSIPSKPYDIEAVQLKYPVDYNESLNTVLPQECTRFNRLLGKMRDTLLNLKRAVKGEVVMTPELDLVGEAFLANAVPEPWLKVSFPSLKPLGSYVPDFMRRLKQFDGWIADGPPPLFWITGFFFAQAFFTGLLQNFARKTKYPIDQCMWNFYVQKRAFEVKEKAPLGCYVYGLIMEGARWDDDVMGINESFPKVLFDELPTMLMDPVLNTADNTPVLVYPCPAYKTSARRGVLSTTGHSTNFIMTVMLPIQSQHTEKYWVKRGTALLSQLDD